MRFFLVSGSGPNSGPGAAASVSADLVRWITTRCQLVPQSAYASASTATGFGRSPGQLYACR